MAYHRVPRLLASLALARGDGRHARMLRALERVERLILDDWGPMQFDADQGRDLLEILEDRRFRSERHLRGFCGLFPRRSDSGGVERPGQKITASGNDRIKRALMLATDTARKIDPKLAQTYWRLMTTKGHDHKQALCAVANRLANRIYSVLRDGRPYVLRDVDGSEISMADAKAIIAERYHVPSELRASRRASRSPRAGA